jgi:phosphopantothenoylcysteine decarboxylase/phosphopantothenate--cysteine ligase
MLSGKRIILGVTGGIAAYKAVYLLRDFQKAGAEVRVCMTPAATQFVGVDTFASLSGHEVAVDIFPDHADADSWTRHIHWGEWADLFVIAPCTANTLAKIAHGFSDNMLCSTVLAARCPILIAPTMDGEMFESPAMQANLKTVKEFGYHIIEPESGYLASGLSGKGRLPENDLILDKAVNILGKAPQPLKGKKVVVTAGATREFVDPVRFISNPSTGKMGLAMAMAAKKLGADVIFIHGDVRVDLPEQLHCKSVTSAEEMFEAVKEIRDADVFIMSAAVSDFTPETKVQQKIKKAEKDLSEIKLKRTQDILGWLGEHKQAGQLLIGFAMETENLIENARKKAASKKAEYILANDLNKEGAGFATDTNHLHLISANGEKEFSGLKEHIALDVLLHIFKDDQD